MKHIIKHIILSISALTLILTHSLGKDFASVNATLSYLPYYSYNEVDTQQDGKEVMRIAGPMLGVVGELNNRFSTPYVAFINTLHGGYYANLSTHYIGQICNNSTNACEPYNTTSNDWYAYGEYHFKPTLTLNLIHLGLDIGGGYRYLHNRIDSSSAYPRDQHYLYSIIGAHAQLSLIKQLHIFASMQYRQLLKGSHKSHFSAIGASNDIWFRQDEGRGYKAEVGARLLFAHLIGSISAFYEMWDIADSNTQWTILRGTSAPTPFFEPQNYTHVLGINVGIGF